jgi:hypothetical protein
MALSAIETERRAQMKTSKADRDGRDWLSPWNLMVFTTGAVAGAILSTLFGAAYTSTGIIVACWLTALTLAGVDRSRANRRRMSTPIWRGRGAIRMKARGESAVEASGAKPAGHARGPVLNVEPLRRSRLRPIIGGKSDPP